MYKTVLFVLSIMLVTAVASVYFNRQPISQSVTIASRESYVEINQNMTMAAASSTQPTSAITQMSSEQKTAANLVAPMYAKNLRWRDLPIPVYLNQTCSSQRSEILQSIQTWESETVISFVLTDQSDCTNCIHVNCFTESDVKKTGDGKFLVVGQGWPTFYSLGDFKIISRGLINLYSTDVKCIKPIRIIHEFGHVLGLDHSTDENNVMYQHEICSSVVTQDIKDTFQNLYSNSTNEKLESFYSK